MSGRGHIRRRGKRSWELKFDLDAAGKRVTRYHSIKGTRKEAEAELIRLQNAVNEGKYTDPSKVTFGEFLDKWERDWCPTNVTPRTAERYAELLRCHVRPDLGSTKLQKLKKAHFVELYAKLMREGRNPADPEKEVPARGLSARTVGHVHRCVQGALRYAVDDLEILAANPVAGITPPKVAREGEIEILNETQIKDVLAKLRGHDLFPLVFLGLSTGMRRGELLALRWCDIDLDGSRLTVERSVEQTKSGIRFKSPKTKYGRRTIALPASAVAELRAHRKDQAEARLKAGLGRLPDDGLVFGRLTGEAQTPNDVTKQWVRARKDLGLPSVTLHAWRHTHASHLIASGMDIATVSRRLGHGSVSITLSVYTHLFEDKSDARAAAIIDAALGS